MFALVLSLLAVTQPPVTDASEVEVVGVESRPPSSGRTTSAPGGWISQWLPARNTWELGVYGGSFIVSERHDLYDLDVGPQRALASAGPELGLRAAYHPLSFLGLEGEFSGVWTHVPLGSDPVFVYGLRGHVMLALPLFRVVPFMVGGYGNLGVRSSSEALGNDIDPAGHYGVGVKLYINRSIAVRLDGHHILSAASAQRRFVAHHGSVTFGVSVTLGRPAPRTASNQPRDRDHDGVADLYDACPAVYGGGPDGCHARDTDGDGLADHTDRCPTEPGSMTDGCPPRDQDGDGFIESRDRCPTEPGMAPDGCPVTDSDADGIVDRDDACPHSIGGAPDGCPAAPLPVITPESVGPAAPTDATAPP